MTSASRLSHLWNSLSSVTRGKLVRCLNTVPRTSGAHNRQLGIAGGTNAHYCGSDCVGEQHEQHHDPREFRIRLI